jgi:SP family general alpha glucoside:H+ symporter-like MFS transporter
VLFASGLNLIMTDLKKPPIEPAGMLEKAEQEHIEVGRRAETDLTVRDAFRYYRPAVMWSALISIATIMESYDMQIINSFYAFPQFQKKYGVQLEEGGYTITAEWQLALSLVALLGLMTGTFINGSVSERFGARKVIMVSLVALTGFVAITFFAPSIEVLLVGELLWYASLPILSYLDY